MESIAVCKFCGQTFYCDAKTEKEREAYAIEQCNCPSAGLKRQKIRYINKARAELAEIFAYKFFNDEKNESADDANADIRIEIEKLLPFMVDFSLLKTDFSISGIGKITLSVNNDGEIKIKRTVSSSIERKV